MCLRGAERSHWQGITPSDLAARRTQLLLVSDSWDRKTTLSQYWRGRGRVAAGLAGLAGLAPAPSRPARPSTGRRPLRAASSGSCCGAARPRYTPVASLCGQGDCTGLYSVYIPCAPGQGGGACTSRAPGHTGWGGVGLAPFTPARSLAPLAPPGAMATRKTSTVHSQTPAFQGKRRSRQHRFSWRGEREG